MPIGNYDRDQLTTTLADFKGDGFLFPAWVNGYMAGIIRNAVWKDGEQLVGVMRTPLSQVLEEIDAIVAELLESDSEPTDD